MIKLVRKIHWTLVFVWEKEVQVFWQSKNMRRGVSRNRFLHYRNVICQYLRLRKAEKTRFWCLETCALIRLRYNLFVRIIWYITVDENGSIWSWNITPTNRQICLFTECGLGNYYSDCRTSTPNSLNQDKIYKISHAVLDHVSCPFHSNFVCLFYNLKSRLRSITPRWLCH